MTPTTSMCCKWRYQDGTAPLLHQQRGCADDLDGWVTVSHQRRQSKPQPRPRTVPKVMVIPYVSNGTGPAQLLVVRHTPTGEWHFVSGTMKQHGAAKYVEKRFGGCTAADDLRLLAAITAVRELSEETGVCCVNELDMSVRQLRDAQERCLVYRWLDPASRPGLLFEYHVFAVDISDAVAANFGGGDVDLGAAKLIERINARGCTREVSGATWWSMAELRLAMAEPPPCAPCPLLAAGSEDDGGESAGRHMWSLTRRFAEDSWGWIHTQVEKAAFHALAAMFDARRPGVDEVEAVYSAGGSVAPLSRDTVLRVLAHLRQECKGAPEVTDQLDVQVDAGGGGGAVLRVTLETEAVLRAALDRGLWAEAEARHVRVVRKARVRPSVAIPDYRMRVNMKEEVPHADPAGALRAVATAMPGKTFRLKRRFSFVRDDSGFRFDVTAVRMMTLAAGGRVPKHAELSAVPETYELEVEYVGRGQAAGAATGGGGEALARSLLGHFSVLLKLVDDTLYLLTPQGRKGALEEYVALAWGAKGVLPEDARARARLFVGPKPTTLELRHLRPEVPGNVLEGYTVTDKADGERRLLLVASDRRVYTVDDRMEPRDTGLEAATLARCLLDGEHLGSAEGFAAFDAYFAAGRDLRSLPLMGGPAPAAAAKPAKGALGGAAPDDAEPRDRLGWMAKVVADLRPRAPGGQAYLVASKDFLRVEGGDDLFRCAKQLLARRNAGALKYHVDGLILTPQEHAVGAGAPGEPHRPATGGKWDAALKWKPPSQNTIDFGVRLRGADEVVVGGSGRSGDARVYQVADLQVGYDPCTWEPITAMAFLTGDAEARCRGARAYVSRPFAPPGFPEAHVAYLARGEDAGRVRCANGDEVVDGSVVEFAFEDAEAASTARPMPYRWRPLRVRRDKMDPRQAWRPNDFGTALSVWRSIRSPVTEAIITGRAPVPDADAELQQQLTTEGGVYYVNKGRRLGTEGEASDAEAALDLGMRRFHNHWVKRECLMMPFKGRVKSLVDLGCGRASDLRRWQAIGAGRVLGLDRYADNLTEVRDGGYARLIRAKQAAQRGAGAGGGALPRVAMLPMDVSQVLGPAYIDSMTDEQGDRTIARVLWGLIPPSAVPHPRLRPYHGFVQPGGFDMVTCMFAVHYFFGDAQALRNFARNVGSFLRPGGWLVGCCLDGARVEALLQGSEEAQGEAEGGGFIWRVRRVKPSQSAGAAQAQADAGPWARVGRPIEVHMRSIGQPVVEYLVDMELLTAALAEVGVHPVASEERVRELGLHSPKGASTGFFDELMEDMAEQGDRSHPDVARALSMSHAERRYSALNRWFVFEKRM